MSFIDELYALGAAARDVLRDLRDVANTPITGASFGKPSGTNVSEDSSPGGLGSYLRKGARFIRRQLRGATGIADFLGYSSLYQEIFQRAPIFDDIESHRGLERVNEEARRGIETARNSLTKISAAGAVVRQFAGPLGAVAGGAIQAGVALADLGLSYAEKTQREQTVKAQLADFIRHNADVTGNLKEKTVTKIRTFSNNGVFDFEEYSETNKSNDAIEKYGSEENALSSLQGLGKAWKEVEGAVAKGHLRDVEAPLEYLKSTGQVQMCVKSNDLYVSAEAARQGKRLYAASLIARGGNRDEED